MSNAMKATEFEYRHQSPLHFLVVGAAFLALRSEISKWGLAVTMLVFTVTLRDRVAEILAAASLLLWAALNWPELTRDRRNA